MLTFTMRLDNETEQQLIELSQLLNLSKSDTVRHCIRSIWLDLNKDHPEAKAALEKLNKIADFMKSLNKQ